MSPPVAAILLGGPNKGTRFRPLSIDHPKPLFPVGGFPLLTQQIKSCKKAGCEEIFLLGFYPVDEMEKYLKLCNVEENISVRYLFEFEPLSTAGGFFHFRDQIRQKLNDDSSIFVLNCDVCSLYPLEELAKVHKNGGKVSTVLCVNSEMESSKQYGNIFIRNSQEIGIVDHYVEKPENCVTSTISCGIYVFSPLIFKVLEKIYKKISSTGSMSLERDVFPELCSEDQLYGCLSTEPFVQIKSAASAISASSIYLMKMSKDLLASGENIIGDVFINKSAKVHPESKLGPNVTIGAGAIVEKGTRIKNAIVLDDCHIKEHTLIMDSVIGWKSEIGRWCRIEGTPPTVNPDKPFSRLESDRLFDSSGRLIHSSTILGKNTFLADELVVRNSIVMPSKNLTYNISNQIVL